MNAPPSLEDAYRLYVPNMLRTLSRLAVTSRLAAPDGMDLIHSFFADEWEGLLERYSPGVGAFDAYFGVSFRRYARRSLLQRARRRSQLVDPSVLETTFASPPGGTSEDARGVQRAVAALPASYGALLRTYFRAGSERAAAEALGWSRHRFRAALAEAVARVALEFAPPGGVDPADWRVTLLVLGTERTPRQAAQLLGISVTEANERHKRALGVLISALYTWAR